MYLIFSSGCIVFHIHDRGRYFEILRYLCFLFHCLLIFTYELFKIYVFILCFVK